MLHKLSPWVAASSCLPSSQNQHHSADIYLLIWAVLQIPSAGASTVAQFYHQILFSVFSMEARNTSQVNSSSTCWIFIRSLCRKYELVRDKRVEVIPGQILFCSTYLTCAFGSTGSWENSLPSFNHRIINLEFESRIYEMITVLSSRFSRNIIWIHKKL